MTQYQRRVSLVAASVLAFTLACQEQAVSQAPRKNACLGRGGHKNLSEAIWWFTFLRAEWSTLREVQAYARVSSPNRRFVLSESRGAFAALSNPSAAAMPGDTASVV
jgi:hypothetical protein